MSVTLHYQSLVTAKETTASGVNSGDSDSTVVRDGLNTTEQFTATASGTPASQVTQVGTGTITIAGGVGSIDLTALTGLNGAALDLTGLKVHTMKLKAGSGNAAAVKVDVGATNGYAFKSATWETSVHPGDEDTYLCRESNPDVGAAAKIFDLTGTNGDTLDYQIIAG